MITRSAKQDLLRRVMNVGCHLTALEHEAYINGVAKSEITQLKTALDAVRSAIAGAAEPEKAARSFGAAMRPPRRD